MGTMHSSMSARVRDQPPLPADEETFMSGLLFSLARAMPCGGRRPGPSGPLPDRRWSLDRHAETAVAPPVPKPAATSEKIRRPQKSPSFQAFAASCADRAGADGRNGRNDTGANRPRREVAGDQGVGRFAPALVLAGHGSADQFGGDAVDQVDVADA
jgi:hypothetical protein